MGFESPIVVLSATTATNALGRALAVAELASEVAPDVRVYGPDDGRLWTGAAQVDLPVRQFGSRRELVADVASLPGRPLVWAIKPLHGSWGAAMAIAQARSVTSILDVDDEDAALSTEFRARSITNRLRLHRGRMLHPRRIRAALREARSTAAGFTFATGVLAEALELPTAVPRLRVPHPRHREADPVRHPRDTGTLHVGCFGTLRLHKGVDALDALITREPSVTLHVFEGAPESLLRHGPGRVVTHPGTTPLAELYAEVDVSLLPQGTSRGARLQLPAKLLDSMRFGVPVMATPTEAIEEVAGDAFYRVEDWNTIAALRDGIRRCAEPGDKLGRAAKKRFDEHLSIEAQAPDFAGFLDRFADSAGSAEFDQHV
jgi:glycosyltransferase involved in cell wall biosynthesis